MFLAVCTQHSNYLKSLAQTEPENVEPEPTTTLPPTENTHPSPDQIVQPLSDEHEPTSHEDSINPFRKFLQAEFGADFTKHAFCKADTSFESLSESTQRKKFWAASRIANNAFEQLCPNGADKLKTQFCQKAKQEQLPDNILRQVEQIGEAIQEASTLREKRYLLSHITFLGFETLKRLGVDVGRKLFDSADKLVLKVPKEEKRVVQRFDEQEIQNFVEFITRFVNFSLNNNTFYF